MQIKETIEDFKNYTKHYNYRRILSYNALINVIIGGRGIGKTFTAKKWLIAKAISQENEQFLFIKRYKEDAHTSAQGFFDKIKPQFTNISDFRARAGVFEARFEETSPWFTIGFYTSLSSFNSKKGNDMYANVSTIFFDEFLIEKGATHYLPDEPMKLYNLSDSIFRDKKWRIVMAANSISIINPYFDFWGINPNSTNRFQTFRENTIVVEFPPNVAKHYSDPKLHALIKGTEYEDFAVNNEFADNNEVFIEKQNGSFYYKFNFEGNIYGVWRNGDHFLISDKYNQVGETYSFSYEDQNEGETGMKRVQIRRLAIKAFHGQVYFTSPKIRETIKPLLNKYYFAM